VNRERTSRLSEGQSDAREKEKGGQFDESQPTRPERAGHEEPAKKAMLYTQATRGVLLGHPGTEGGKKDSGLDSSLGKRRTITPERALADCPEEKSFG